MKIFDFIAFCFGMISQLVAETQKRKRHQQLLLRHSAKAVSNAPVMTFDRTIHDFGTIQEGERVETLFTFTNTGKSDLVIVDARGSCGCTVPEYPKNTPIAPGAKDKFVLALILATNLTCNKKQLPFLPIQIQSRNHPYKSHGTS